MNERKDGIFPKDRNDLCLEKVQDLTEKILHIVSTSFYPLEKDYNLTCMHRGAIMENLNLEL